MVKRRTTVLLLVLVVGALALAGAGCGGDDGGAGEGTEATDEGLPPLPPIQALPTSSFEPATGTFVFRTSGSFGSKTDWQQAVIRPGQTVIAQATKKNAGSRHSLAMPDQVRALLGLRSASAGRALSVAPASS